MAALQLASVHAMQANDLLKDSSVVQISIEAEKPIFAFMADVLDNPRSLTAQIFDNPQTRAVFETEMKKSIPPNPAANIHICLTVWCLPVPEKCRLMPVCSATNMTRI